MYSVTKSVISILVGIALNKGLIGSIDDSITKYVPEPISSALPPDGKTISIRHLLTMTSGFNNDGGMGVIDESGLKSWLSAPLASSPGQTFTYNGTNANLLSIILTKTTGLKASDFAREFLFRPLGIDKYQWLESVDYTLGSYGLSLRTRDLAKLGYLYLKQGKWNRKTITTQDWVEESSRYQVDVPPTDHTPELEEDYGFLWWTMTFKGHPAYSAMGYNGQHICIIPDLNLLVVITGTGGGMMDRLAIVDRFVLAAVAEGL